MSNPNIAPIPLPDDERKDPATMDVDGETVLDPDTNDALVDSAEADRVASEEPTDAQDSTSHASEQS